jgi:drug/metabolite transporter (DMT)-like permease
MAFGSLSLTALGFTAGASLCLASSGIVSKKATAHAPAAVTMFWFMIPCTLVGLGWLLLKGDYRLTAAYWPPFAASWILNIVANLAYLRALKTAEASLVGASMGLVSIFAAIVARVYLHEALDAVQWAGIVLSFAGIVVMYIPEQRTARGRLDVFAFFRRFDSWLLLLMAFGWGADDPFDKAASLAASPQMHCFLIYAAMLPPAFVLAAAQRRALRLPPAALRVIFAAGGLRGTGYAMQLLALLLMPVGVFEAVKRVLQQAFSLAGGRLAYGEKITRPKIAGSLIFCCAVPMMVFG